MVTDMKSPIGDMGKVLYFDKPFSKKLSIFVKKFIYADMRKGKLQGKQDIYRSKRYIEYKKRYMVGKEKGTKIKSYEGVSVRSNRTESVNMLLTGQLIDGLEYDSNTKTTITVTYQDKDRGKIKGNENMGRDVRTLNKGNVGRVKQEIVKKFNQGITKHLKKNITINVGL